MDEKILKKVFGISPASATELIAKLTPRQRQVAELLAQGMKNQEIAERLGISRKTLDIHRHEVAHKLGVPVIGIPRIWFVTVLAEL